MIAMDAERPLPPPGDDRIVPLRVAGAARGRIIPPVARALGQMPSLFERSGRRIPPAGRRTADAAARSRLLQDAAEKLRAAGLVPGWRDEHCALLDDHGTELARFERGAFRTLGLQNRAVHVNGFLPDGRVWIARRSARKASSPNKLDNLAAGAIAAGETPEECAVRELWEEASVAPELAVLAVFPGVAIRSLRPLRHGMHDEIILCADLELPGDFVPECQDGEVAEFLCMTREEVRAALSRMNSASRLAWSSATGWRGFRSMTESPHSERLGPIELAPGITRTNVLTKLLAAFIGIGALAGISILQSYILTAHLHVPRAQQGTLSGNLAFWSEVVGLILFIPFGMMADRIGRRPLLSFGLVVVGIGWGLYPFATSATELMVFRLIYAVGAAATAGTLATLVNDYPLESSRGKLIGITSAMNTLGTMFVTGVIGRIPHFLAQRGYDPVTGGRAMFLAGAALCVLIGLLTARGLAPGTPARRTERPPLGALAGSIARALTNPRIGLAYAGALVARSDVVVKGLFLGLWAVHAGREAGLDPGRAMARFGVMIIVMYIVSLVAAPLFGWFIDRVHRVTAMIVALATAAAGYLSMRFLTSPLDFDMIPLLILLTLGTGFMVKSAMALIGQEAPVAERSSVIAGSSVCGAFGILIFTAVGGRLFDAWGPWAPFMLAGAYQSILLVIAIIIRVVAPGDVVPKRAFGLVSADSRVKIEHLRKRPVAGP